MILVDKQIRELVDTKGLIVNFNDVQLGAISYDLVIDNFVIENDEVDSDDYLLTSSEFVYVKMMEPLNVPYDLCCKVIEKNSIMRMGLKVDGPLYQPGHNTNIYIRV